jgi:hypothetical protein
MTPAPSIVAINYFFGPDDLNNRIFAPGRRDDKARFMRAFHAEVRRHGDDVVTLDTVDGRDPLVRRVLYFDYSWRLALHDPYLARVPRAKRALAIIEPANINPSLYYTSVLRNRFQTVFTWDLNLLRRNPDYVAIHVPAGASLLRYRDNPFGAQPFADKRLLVAVNANRWSYMPRSTYGLRIRLFRHFESRLPGQFDLYGRGWNAPAVRHQKWFGHANFGCYRGPLATGEDKLRTMSGYRFALCVENNLTQPGYTSEKMLDCFCARCVPVYYGWRGAGDCIPREAWIDLRAFPNWGALAAFLQNMDAAQHQRYLDAAEAFLRSERATALSTEHLLRVLANRLCSGRSINGATALEPMP